jgi:sugar/nucleoside kinase (ribokinase family)
VEELMSQKSFDIIVVGHLCVDIIPKFVNSGKKIADILYPGKLVNVEDAKISTGGPVSNTGINMKTLGNKVCFCACVGDDVFGGITIDLLGKNGNAEGVSIVKGKSSSYTIVLAPPEIDRIFLHNPGTNNLFGPEYLNLELVKECKLFHFGYPPLMERMFADDGSELEEIFKIAKKSGATTSCDMTLPDPLSRSGKAPWRKILQRILPYIDIYLPSIEETFYMLWPEEFLARKVRYKNAELINFITSHEYSRIANEILAMGAKIVALKSGHRGFYIKTGTRESLSGMEGAKPKDLDNWANRELWAPAFVVDRFGSATGSGDSSIAGFLSALLRGLSIEDALKYATCVGLQNVRVLDAVSGIKTWDETTAMLRQNLPMIDICVNDSGWKWDEKNKLWTMSRA